MKDYSTERVLNILNSELADTLGNLVSRCTGKVVNVKGEIPPAIYGKALRSEAAESLRKHMDTLGDTARQHYESFYIHHAVDAVMTTLRSANIMVEHHKPWQLRKEPHNEMAMTELKAVISLALEAIRISALVLYPVVPTLSTNLLDFLNVPLINRSWNDTRPKYLSPVTATEAEPFRHQRTMFFPKIKLAAQRI